MMMRSVFLRTLFDKRWFMIGWSAAIGGMAILMVAMFPSLSKGMADIAASMPPQLRGLVGDIASFTQLDSFITSQLYDIRIPLFLMIMATVLAIGQSVSLEEKGVLRTVLSGKTSRASWFMHTWFAAVILFAVALAVTTGMTLLAVKGINDSIDIYVLLKLALMSLSFAVTVFTIVFAVGVATGSRTITLAVGVGMIVTSFILQAGKAVDWLEPFQTVSMLNYYDASDLLRSGLNYTHQMILMSLLLIFLLVGLLFFRRRDVS
jgi:ABC-type transport system involved in multi-copper enzyme maturation permease subunit